MKITGTLIKNYFHCKRQAWLYYYGINFENELTRIGRIKHIDAGSEEIAFNEIKIDKIKNSEVIEYKKTFSNIEGTKMQLLYYLYILKNNGIIKTGLLKDLTYGDKETLILNNENFIKVEKLLNEIKQFIKSNKIILDKNLKKRDCKGCSFYEYCWC